MPRGQSPEERFEDKVVRVPMIDCWIWGAGTRRGYGVFYMDPPGYSIGAYRAAYRLYVNEDIPDGAVVDHKCLNTNCVNPAHLRVISLAENSSIKWNYTSGNADTTHCPRGHKYTEENTYIHNNKRYCRECNRARYHTSGKCQCDNCEYAEAA